MNQDWASGLFTISNTWIAIASVVCSVILAGAWRWVGARSLQQRTPGRSTVYLFVFIQIGLLILLPAYRNTIIIYLFLFLVGSNLHALLAPSFLKHGLSAMVIAPVFGLIVVSALGSYFIAF